MFIQDFELETFHVASAEEDEDGFGLLEAVGNDASMISVCAAPWGPLEETSPGLCKVVDPLPAEDPITVHFDFTEGVAATRP